LEALLDCNQPASSALLIDQPKGMLMSFVTILTPLTALPIIFGLFIGVWGCLTIIAGAYGLDLTTAVPWIASAKLNEDLIAPFL